MRQIGLPLAWPDDRSERDFIIGDANAGAVRHLTRWSLWPVMTTLLTGPRKSGRSLLGRLFTAKTGGRLIDDAEARPEEELFHAWNAAQAERQPLLIIADLAPPAWALRLPDLRSRLLASPHISIAEPDDALLRALLERQLGARGLAPSREVVAWLAPRIERTYLALNHVVDALDEAALARRARLTVPFARSVVGEGG